MNNIKLNEKKFIKNNVLQGQVASEKCEEIKAGMLELALVSKNANTCSFPKYHIKNEEKEIIGNNSEAKNENVNNELDNDLLQLTGKSLMIKYKREFDAWKNSKYRANKMKEVKGKKFDTKFASFPGFLKIVGTKPHDDYSLDRIDPEYGYLEGNVRWASKQLQSENRKFVKEYEVNGKPMSMKQLAASFGISYDAFRMALRREPDIKKVIARYTANAKSKQINIKSIIASPWPEETKAKWEERYKKEVHNSSYGNSISRCRYYLKICEEQFNLLKTYSDEYGSSPPEEFVRKCDYWQSKLIDAKNKCDLESREIKRKISLEPPQEIFSIKK